MIHTEVNTCINRPGTVPRREECLQVVFLRPIMSPRRRMAILDRRGAPKAAIVCHGFGLILSAVRTGEAVGYRDFILSNRRREMPARTLLRPADGPSLSIAQIMNDEPIKRLHGCTCLAALTPLLPEVHIGIAGSRDDIETQRRDSQDRQ